MDDGNINIYNENTQASNVRFHTEGFSYEENELLQKILDRKFQIKSSINSYKRNNHELYYITLGKEASETLHDLIKEYIHPSMEYKLPNNYRGFFNESLYFTHSNLSNVTTKLITSINQLEKEEVFNLEVQDNNNYFVNGILTHNCQNLTRHAFKSIMTRIGENSKYVFLGDVEQIDRKKQSESCLAEVLDIFKDEDFIGTIEFLDEDCVRNPLIPKILEKLRERGI